MSGQNPSEQLSSLGMELQRTNPEPGETRFSFLARLAGVAAEHPDAILGKADLEAVGQHLAVWEFDDKRLGEETLVIARRVFSSGKENASQLERYNETGRRALRLTKDKKIMMVAKTAFTGSDLQTIFKIEQENAPQEEPIPPAGKPKSISKAKPAPKPKPAAKRKSTAKSKTEIIETPSGLRLRPRQANAVNLLARPYSVGAMKMSIEPNTFAKNIEAIIENNGMVSVEQFVEVAMKDGLIDMTPLDWLERPQLSADEQLALELTLYARKTGEEMEDDPQMKTAFEAACEKLDVNPHKPYHRALTFVRAKHFGYI